MKKTWFEKLIEIRRLQKRTKIIKARRNDEAYLERISLIKIPGIFQIAIHIFYQSDDDVGLHDHPWIFWGGKILKGSYYEHLPNNKVIERNPSTGFKWGTAWNFHRVQKKNENDEVITLFVMGPKIKIWGFINENGIWESYKNYFKRVGKS